MAETQTKPDPKITDVRAPTLEEELAHQDKKARQAKHKSDRPSFGDPRDLATNPSFPATRSLVEVKEPSGRLGLYEVRLNRHLHHLGYEDLRKKRKTMHEVPIADVMPNKHTGRDQLQNAITNLMKYVVQVEVGDEWRAMPLLSEARIKNGILYFQFPPTIQEAIMNPVYYNRICVRVMYHMTSKYGVRLYDILAGHYKKDTPIHYVAIDDLHDMLGTTEKPSLHRPANVEGKILKPARDDINKWSPFKMNYELVKRGKRTLIGVRFYLTEKPIEGQEAAIVEMSQGEGLLPIDTSAA